MKWCWCIELKHRKIMKQITWPYFNLKGNEIICPMFLYTSVIQINEIRAIFKKIEQIYGKMWKFYKDFQRLSMQTKMWVLTITGHIRKLQRLGISN